MQKLILEKNTCFKEIAAGICFVWLISVLFAYAWMCDDAFITLRVVRNAVEGYGLRWNLDERVQVYTHPLWMLLEIPFYVMTGKNPHLTSLLLSLCTGATAIWLLLRSAPACLTSKLLFVILPLAATKLTHDFISSGLETPLQWLLLAVFFTHYLRNPDTPYRLYFIAALCLLTRMDMIVILLPALISITLKHVRKKAFIKKSVIAVSPYIAWLLFSLLYYGFIFPNTKYAKLNTGMQRGNMYDMVCSMA